MRARNVYLKVTATIAIIAEVVLAEDRDDRLLRDDRLHDRGDEEAEGKRPEDLPEHEEGHLQRLPDRVDHEHDGYAFTSR
jgi:hypothetical protein